MSQALGLVHGIPVPFHLYKDPRMQVFWLSYRTNSHISVVSHRKPLRSSFSLLLSTVGVGWPSVLQSTLWNTWLQGSHSGGREE